MVVLLVAAGVALLRQPTFANAPYAGPIRADPSRLRHDVAYLTEQRSESFIAREFRAAGGRVTEQTFVARRREYRNVIASFGPDDDSPLLIIGAHYDVFSPRGNMLPGADDNASGTAALLELARLLGRQPPSHPVMLVAYANEEPPFFGTDDMGSAVHAASLAANGRPVGGMICLEMIGYFTPRQPWDSWVLSALYPSSGDFIAVAGGWATAR